MNVEGIPLPQSSIHLLVPPVRLMSACIWQVAQQRRVEQYGVVAELISFATEVAPHLLSFRQRAQLILGLRAKLILHRLQNMGPFESRAIQDHLKFVQLWTTKTEQEEDQEEEVEISKSKFVELVQTLLKDPSERDRFFKDVFPVQYGPRFDTALQILVWEFLSQLEEFLTVPSFSEIAASINLEPADFEEFEQFISDPDDLKRILQHYKPQKLIESLFSFRLDTILSTLASKQTEVYQDTDEHTKESAILQRTVNHHRRESSVERDKNMEEGKLVQPGKNLAVESNHDKTDMECADPLDEEAVDCSSGFMDSDFEQPGEISSLKISPFSSEAGLNDPLNEEAVDGSSGFIQSNFKHQGEMTSVKISPFSSEASRNEKSCGTSLPAGITCPLHPYTNKGLVKPKQHTKKVHTEDNLIQEIDFRPRSQSVEHQKCCSTKNKHNCLQCGKTFGSPSELKEHRYVHSTVQLYDCNQCEKRFKTKSYLKSHLRIHANLKPHVCSYCGRGFSLLRVLETHVRTHTGERPFACTICDKKFAQKSALRVHLRVHKGEKPYLCSDCGKAFCDSGAFLVHSRLHTGERPYHCEFCGKNYITLQRLKVHQRYHTGERPYSCNYCEKCFHHSHELKRHSRTHTGEKPFQCPKCNKRFSQRYNMKVHLRSHK